MADVAVVAGDLINPSATPLKVTAGATAIDQFDAVYLAGGLYYPCDNSTVVAANAVGIALTRCDGNGTFLMVTSGTIESKSAVFTAGNSYLVSGTSGKWMPEGDLTTSDWVTGLGRAQTTKIFEIDIDVGGYQIP